MALTFDKRFCDAVRGMAEKLYRSSPVPGASAEDLCQETLTKLWANRDHYDPAKSPSAIAWAWQIARNVHIDAARSRQRKAARESSKVDAALLQDHAPRPDDAAAERELMAEVEKAVAGVDETQREVLMCRATDRADLRDLSVELGVSYKRVVRMSASASAELKRQLDRQMAVSVPGVRSLSAIYDVSVYEGAQRVWTFLHRPRGPLCAGATRTRSGKYRNPHRGLRGAWVQIELPLAA